MAEPTPKAPHPENQGDAKPKLISVDAQAGGATRTEAPARASADEPGRRSRWLPGGLLFLLLVAIGAAALQSQRLGEMTRRNVALSEKAQALEVQLSAATLQIQSYELQQTRVRALATRLAEQVSELQSLVEPGAGAAVEEVPPPLGMPQGGVPAEAPPGIAPIR